MRFKEAMSNVSDDIVISCIDLFENYTMKFQNEI